MIPGDLDGMMAAECAGSACARRVKVKVEAHTATTASGAVSRSGIRMHQRPRKSSAKPASGPECSVPATGWPGAK